MIRIRRAAPSEAEQMMRIYVDSSNAGFGPRMPLKRADQARLSRWRAELAQPPPARWWVAERGADVVGIVGIGPSRDPVDAALGELDTIAVDPPAWRTGVGRALMARALQALAEDGYRSALLWTLADYPLGRAFYDAMGWRPNGATREGGTQVRYDHSL